MDQPEAGPEKHRSLLHEFPPNAEAKAVKAFPFIERTGLELLLSERGRAVLRLPLAPNVNHVGTMYAGALFTLAETPGGTLFLSAFDIERFYPIVGDLNLRFRSPASTPVLADVRMSDSEIERVESELSETGKSKWVLEHELIDERGVVVATSSATYFGRAL